MNKIQILKYKTKGGNKMELTNCPMDMGISLMFLSLDRDTREAVLSELQEDHRKRCAEKKG